VYLKTMESSIAPPEPTQSQSASPKWQCFPCKEGLQIKLPAQFTFYLPLHVIEDRITDIIPLSVEIDENEVCELRREWSQEENVSVIAATHYGPPPPIQDKSENQDFSLSAIIRDPKGREWAYVSVADGVSTRTFWPARASRIACIVAYQVIRRFILENCDRPDQQNQSLFENLRGQLGVELQNYLKRDQANLKEAGIAPASWSAETYKKFIERDQLWYNSTLLLALLGPQYGLVLYAGDGGIELVNHYNSGAPECLTILKTEDTLAIDSFVSLAITGRNFAGRTIFYSDQIKRVDVYLSSDGVDRTLQLNGNIPHHHLRMHSSHEAYRRLNELTEKEKCEADNYSIARASRIFGEGRHEARVYEAHSKKPENRAEEEMIASLSGRPAGPNSPHNYSSHHDDQTRKPFGAQAIVIGVVGLVIGAFIGVAVMAWIKNQTHSTLHAVASPIPISGGDEDLLAKENKEFLARLYQNQLSEWMSVISREPDRNYVVIAHLSCSDQGKQKNKRARRIAAVIQDLLVDKAEEYERLPKIRASIWPCHRPPRYSQLVNTVYLAIDTEDSNL
jgi:hypothetical protein